jgi:antitoxin component YwqK of YwqJK toxin-antitoxin module
MKDLLNTQIIKSFIAVTITCFLLPLYSCNQTENTNEIIVEKFNNGNVKTKRQLTSMNDTTNFIYLEYYENGKLMQSGPMKDSIIYGQWKFFYDNGKLKEQGTFIIDDSLNTGEWTYRYIMPLKDEKGNIIHEPDSLWSRAYRAEREKKNLHICKEGDWESYHENGTIKSKGKYEKGWLSSKWTEYSTSGQLILESYYEKSRPIHKWNYWYPNGQLMKIIQYTDSSKLLLEAYDKKGNVKIIKGNGIFYESHPSDTSKSILATYKNGILNGQYVQYFDNRKIEEKGQFKNGKTDGKWIYYYYYYGLSLVRNYKDGLPHGYFYRFSTLGDTTQVRYFVNGLEHGIRRDFEGAKGKVTLIEPWNMGKRHGIRKFFDFNGDPELFEYFYNDEIVAEERFSKLMLIDRKVFNIEKYNKLKTSSLDKNK